MSTHRCHRRAHVRCYACEESVDLTDAQIEALLGEAIANENVELGDLARSVGVHDRLERGLAKEAA